MNRATRPRLAVLGLDGLSLSLARELAAKGGFPALERLSGEGAATVDSELPELSPVNWTSFFTGEGPGTHGVFGFSRINAKSYELSVTDFSQVACPTIFDTLGERGLTSKVVNLPNTYPARPFPGMLVSGFVARDLAKAVHPPYLAHALAGEGYVLEPDTARGARDVAYLLDELSASLASRVRALELLWPDLAWDLFVFVITETDRLFHFLMHAVEDRFHPLHGQCLDFLRQVDRAAARFLELYDALPEPKRLMALADHGFTTSRTEVDVNVWLRENGLQAKGILAKDEWDAASVAKGSWALALDPGRIYFNATDRFPGGWISRREADTMADEVKRELMALTWRGERVMEGVYTGRELYQGPMAPHAPDLVCLARPGFDLKAKFDRDEIFGSFGRTGCHTADGALFYDTHKSRPARMRDVGREILHAEDFAQSLR